MWVSDPYMSPKKQSELFQQLENFMSQWQGQVVAPGLQDAPGALGALGSSYYNPFVGTGAGGKSGTALADYAAVALPAYGVMQQGYAPGGALSPTQVSREMAVMAPAFLEQARRQQTAQAQQMAQMGFNQAATSSMMGQDPYRNLRSIMGMRAGREGALADKRFESESAMAQLLAGIRSQAISDQWQQQYTSQAAAAAKSAGKSQMIGGLLGGIGSIVGGALGGI